jgi:predicted NBD/HSP70 family sugar kinase
VAVTEIDTAVACVEVGASGSETVLLDRGRVVRTAGALPPIGVPLLMAVPGLVAGSRVIAASNLGWYDVDPADRLGLPGPVALLRNDAEAAALGESVLRGGVDLVFVGLGTGVGGAVVRGGEVHANLFGHHPGFGDRDCPCGRTGCLETVAAGWALPDPISDIGAVGVAVAAAIDAEPLATPSLVVVAGGLAARHPAVIDVISAGLPNRTVEPTAAPAEAKSAAAWGLRHAYLTTAV